MNYENLKAQILNGLYPNPYDMQRNLDYAKARRKITDVQHKELTILLEQKEQEKYQ